MQLNTVFDTSVSSQSVTLAYYGIMDKDVKDVYQLIDY